MIDWDSTVETAQRKLIDSTHFFEIQALEDNFVRSAVIQDDIAIQDIDFIISNMKHSFQQKPVTLSDGRTVRSTVDLFRNWQCSLNHLLDGDDKR